MVREVHPEMCFCRQTNGASQGVNSGTRGADARARAVFSELHLVEKWGRDQGLPIEDILDAAVACWSALRLVGGKGRSLPACVPLDTTGLPMAIWV